MYHSNLYGFLIKYNNNESVTQTPSLRLLIRLVKRVHYIFNAKFLNKNFWSFKISLLLYVLLHTTKGVLIRILVKLCIR